MTKNEVHSAVAALERGDTLLYPTDTIWGVGCDATNVGAVEKVYSIKHRDHSKSMLILCADVEMVERFVSPAGEEVRNLLLYDGRPTTVIMPLESSLMADNLAASDGSIGVRIPQMDFCQSLLQLFGKPVVSTSANFSGRPSPQTYADIEEELKARVDYCVPPEYEQETAGQSSRIVKLLSDGTLSIIRD